MATDFELGSILSGRKRAEGGVHHIDSAIILGEAVEDSVDGKVRVVPYGDVFNPDGDNTVTMTTSPSVKAGDTVQISLVGGVSKRPMVVAVGGSGDRTAAKAADAKATVDEVKRDIADFKSGADVDYAIYSYVDDEIGEFSQTISADYLSKTEAQTTYATQSQLTQTAESIEASVSQDYVSKTDAQTTYATKSELNITADGISSVVSTKVGSDEVISKINQSSETIQIEAERIEFDGTVVFNAIKNETDAAYDANGAAATVQANLIAEEGERKAIYGTCSTAAGTAAKDVTCANFELFTGARIAVKFSTANTTAAPTLDVNGTGAKAIWYNNAVASSSNPVLWGANATLSFVYDGTEWVLDEKPPSYVSSSSSGATGRDKTAAVAGALVVNGTTVSVAFTTANTYASNYMRLNVGGTGLARIYYNNVSTSAANTLFWAANTSLTFVRQGAGWYLADNGMRKNITQIDDNGISIHAANNPTTNYIQLNSNGMEVFKGGVSAAQFGETTTIGNSADTTKPYMVLDADSLDLFWSNMPILHLGINETTNTPYILSGYNPSFSASDFGGASATFGEYCRASATDSFAAGHLCQVNSGANNSAAIGNNLRVIAANQVVVGCYNDATVLGDARFVVGNGYNGSPSNAFAVWDDGSIKYKAPSTRFGETSGADIAITRTYTANGFAIENAVFHATADMVVMPVQFTATSNVALSAQKVATIPAAYAPAESARCAIWCSPSWSGSDFTCGYVDVSPSGEVSVTAPSAKYWFGQVVWIRA